MRSSRVFQGLMVGVGAAALLFAGCERDDGDDDADEEETEETDNGEEADRDTTDPERADRGGVPSDASYAMFPENSEMVAGLAFASVRESALWEHYWDTIVSAIDADNEFADAQEACGFDPFAKLENVMIGGETGNEDELLIVVEGFSRDEITSCAEAVAALQDEELEITADGDFDKLSDGDGDGIWLAWIGDRTMATGGPALEGDDDEGRAWLEQRVSGEAGLAADSPLAQLVEDHVERHAGLWFGMIPDDDGPVGGEMALAGGPQPQAIFGSIAPSDGLDIAAGLRFSSADEAQELHETATQMLPLVKAQAGELEAVIDNAELSVEDTDMLVSLSLSQEELAQLVDGVTEMFGDFGAAFP